MESNTLNEIEIVENASCSTPLPVISPKPRFKETKPRRPNSKGVKKRSLPKNILTQPAVLIIDTVKNEDALLEANRKRRFRSMDEFITQKKVAKSESTESKVKFLPFQIKDGMILSPEMRRPSLFQFEREALDKIINAATYKPETNLNNLYLKEIHNGLRIPRKSTKTLLSTDQDVVVLDLLPLKKSSKTKVKLLSFHENYRPPYYGTWTKNSFQVKPRRPFGKHNIKSEIDYEIDSEEEWESEPEDAEECKSDEDEGDSDVEEDEDDEGWMVAHGYLSDSEGVTDEDEELDPDMRRERMRIKAAMWEKECKEKRIDRLKPFLIPPQWAPLNENDQLAALLLQFEAVCAIESFPLLKVVTTANLVEIPQIEKTAAGDADKVHSNTPRTPCSSRAKKLLPLDKHAELIKFIHGSCLNKDILAYEFQQRCLKIHAMHFPRTEIIRTIQMFAKCERAVGASNKCWSVNQSFLEYFGLENLQYSTQAATPAVSSSEFSNAMI